MATTTERLQLYEHARKTWGDDPARTLMELLPDDPDQLATKRDLAVLGAELRQEMAELRGELHLAMADQTRTLVLGAVGAIMTATALSFAASHLV